MSHSAAEVIAALIDPGSWQSWDTSLPHPEGDSPYHEQRRTARAASGTDEAGITGRALIEGIEVALIVGEFNYLAGSIGHDAADRVIAAYERAARERLPVIAAPRSGGTRMQEGTPAFLRMAGLAASAAAHRSAGLPSLVLLRSPTTGGVLATWGSLGHISIAEPGALVGFLGPRVYQEVMGEPFPKGVQSAEHLLQCGVLDGVADLSEWREAAGRMLRVYGSRSPGETVRLPGPPPAVPAHPDPHAWQRVEASRRHDRPGAAQLLALGSTDVIPIPGTGTGERAEGLIIALARWHGRGVVVVAQDRAAQAAGRRIGPWSLRSAQRAMFMAEELHLPLVTIIDTPGAELSPEAERGALAGEIARCLAHLSRLSTPSVSVLLGQGTGGGAIALLPCDHVIAAENAWVTPLPPEGAAAIVHRDAGQAPRMAAEQRVTAAALAAVGAVDEVIAEQGDWLALLSRRVAEHVDEVVEKWSVDGPARRTARWEAIGRPM